MSLRSRPSPAKWTTTTPPASTPVTTPSPNAAWTTSSPIRKTVAGCVSSAVAALAPAHEVTARPGQVEVAHRARQPDVGEPALLLDVALVDRARVREHPVLHPDDEDDRVLEALRIVQRHQRDEALVVGEGVLGREQRELLQPLLD